MTKTALIALIYLTAAKYNLPPALFRAIIMQESSLSQDLVKDTDDLGLAQISPTTAKAFGFDPQRLKSDVAYSIECGAIYLAYLKSHWESREPLIWFTRYHSGNDVLRFRYKLAISRRLDE